MAQRFTPRWLTCSGTPGRSSPGWRGIAVEAWDVHGRCRSAVPPAIGFWGQGASGNSQSLNSLRPLSSSGHFGSRDPGVVVAVLGRRHAAEGVVGSVLVVVDQDDAGRRARIRFLPCPYWHVSVPNPHG